MQLLLKDNLPFIPITVAYKGLEQFGAAAGPIMNYFE
jgi:hypothetical protein